MLPRVSCHIRPCFHTHNVLKTNLSTFSSVNSYTRSLLKYPPWSPRVLAASISSTSHNKHGRRQQIQPSLKQVSKHRVEYNIAALPLTSGSTIQPTEKRYLSTASTVAPKGPPSSLISPDLQPYTIPATGLLSKLPASWVPFAELCRIDKPAGSYYLFFPCLFSTLLAGSYAGTPPLTILHTSLLFATGALVMRGAGCTINDLWDRNLDPHVARTRLRPLARRAVTPFAALAFAGAQCLVGLGVLVQFPYECLAWGIPSLLLVGTYPLAKRVTHYPQFVLGLTFSWGAFMGFPALNIDLLADQSARLAAGLLYASCTAWTVLYDMIYAHMDVKDDKNAGIKSIVLKHGHQTKGILAGLAVVQIGLLAGAGAAVGAGPAFYLGTCGGAAATLGTMIRRVDLASVANCWWWFRYGAWWTGGAISMGLLGEYIDRRRSKEVEESNI